VRQGFRCVLCEKRPGGALCQTQPFPAGSKTSPLQGTAEVVSNAGGISVTAYLRKGKKHWMKAVKGGESCERNDYADVKVSEGEERGAPGAGAEIPQQPMEKITEKWIVLR